MQSVLRNEKTINRTGDHEEWNTTVELAIRAAVAVIHSKHW